MADTGDAGAFHCNNSGNHGGLFNDSTRTFATSANIRVLIQGMSVDMMIAIPMAISLIAGNIDFSVGSALCLSSYIGCMAMGGGMPGWLGILVGLGAGAVLGGLNALIINKFKITPLIATLGTWMAYQELPWYWQGQYGFKSAGIL